MSTLHHNYLYTDKHTYHAYQKERHLLQMAQNQLDGLPCNWPPPFYDCDDYDHGLLIGPQVLGTNSFWKKVGLDKYVY